jgi:hypothetical protein
LSLIQDNKWDREHAYCIGASEAGHCNRAIRYRLEGFPKEKYSTQQLAIFQRGILLEPLVAEIARSNGWTLRIPDNPYTDFYNTPGIDLGCSIPIRFMTTSLDYIADDGEMLYDFQIKCVNDWHFKHLKKTKNLLEDSPYYYWQVQAEMYCAELDGAILYVCNVNDMSTNKIFVDYNPAWEAKRKELVEVWMNVMEGIDDIPEREYKQTDWNCKYCDYRNICWGEE